MPIQEHHNHISTLPVPLPDSQENRSVPPPSRRRRWWIIGAVIVIVLGVGLFFGIPFIWEYFTTVSTDDANVNSHMTTVAPRVEANVTEVMVDNGNFVTAGTVLLKLDPEPYRVIVEQKRAALDVAQSQLTQTLAKVRSEEATARSSWFALLGAENQVRAQIAALHANLANLRLAQSNLNFSRSQLRRIETLAPSGAATREELDQARNAVQVAENQVAAAQEAMQQTRANLGLPRNEKNPLDVPDKLEQTFPAVQVALSNTVTALAQIGVLIPLHELTPDQLYKHLVEMTPSHDLNKTLDELVDKAPETQLARAKVEQARKDLEQAELNLSYTVIRADINGIVNQRNVNRGDHVMAGQNLMTVRSLDDVWIDANFKETQLDNVVIGQPVDITVDAYPHKVFKGRVAGFTPATGSMTALLPPENATGNFVKIVQRLPVRIELTEPNPSDTPLFAGLSVVPTVRLRGELSGPNAGKRIQDEWKAQAPAASTPPARQRGRETSERRGSSPPSGPPGQAQRLAQ